MMPSMLTPSTETEAENLPEVGKILATVKPVN